MSQSIYLVYELNGDQIITYKKLDSKFDGIDAPLLMFVDDSLLVYGYTDDLQFGRLHLNIPNTPESIDKYFQEQKELQSMYKLGEIL